VPEKSAQSEKAASAHHAAGNCSLSLLVALVAFAFAALAADLVEFSPALLAHISKRFGGDATARMSNWQKLVRQIKGSDLAEKSPGKDKFGPPASASSVFGRVNLFFNRLPYNSDQALWNVPDYWATPVEMLGMNGGDCEDYAIGKYLTLKELGVPIDRLRITYVRALSLGVTHMVLAYYPDPDAEPWILDNLTNDIKLASARSDLEPVFSFNDDELWSGSTVKKQGATQIRLWKNLLEKLEQEKRM
jgi:predicted transglutaminase-like cysteine proteinase